MKFKFKREDIYWYTYWKIYQSNNFRNDSIWWNTSFAKCTRVWVLNDNWTIYNLEKHYWELVYEEVPKWTEVINTQTNEMKYALWTRTIGKEVYIIVKHNQDTLAWRYTDCEIVTKEVTETLIDNNITMNTLDNLIAEEEFSAEVMNNIANEYKKIKSNIKSLEEEIKSKQELLDLNLDLAYKLNQWVETKDIDLVNEAITQVINLINN